MRFSTGILELSLTIGLLGLTFPGPAGAKNPAADTVREVDSKFVCMVEKKYFDEPQKPVRIADRFYYACSDACAAKLTEDPASRMDVDPVSGNHVDKATATVGVDRAGNVYFFENADNLKQFRVPFESAGSGLSATSRASHPRR